MQSESSVKVTIVVPIHNSEEYLQQCLESALSQTLCDIEILCIDSSGTDRCFQIIAKLKERDNRIIYIKDPDSSYGYKINVGIEMAKGNYIAILEADDWMSPDMTEKLYAAGELYHADIVNSDYFQFFEYKGKKFGEKCKLYSNADGSGIKVCSKLLNASINVLWTALYRKSFLLANNIRLNESPGASYQDVSFLFLTGILAKSVHHLDEPLYWYRTDNAGSSVKDDKKIFETADEYQFLKQELEKRNVKDTGVWNLFYYKKYRAFYWNYQRLSERARERFLKRYFEELKDDIETGALNRDTRDENFYQCTFLLMDDLERFKEAVDDAGRHRSMMAMRETLERLEGREIVVFGAGLLGGKIINVLQRYGNKIVRICDNAERLHGTTLVGLEIGPVAETVKRFPDACYLIVSRKYSEEMKAQLLAEGVSEENVEIFT